MDAFIYAEKKVTEKPTLNFIKEHTHDDYEIFCFLAGDAKYYVEGSVYDLEPNDILIIKKSETHNLLVNKTVPYERYVINFTPAALLKTHSSRLIDIIDEKPLGRSNRINQTDEQKQIWLYYIENIVNAKAFEDKRLYLTILLSELCENINKTEYESHTLSETGRIIEFINQNLMTISTLEEICEHFHISKTHLNRKFKSITGSTVWDYIITKRLITAKDMLLSGYKPNEVAEKCGWMEYSSFYRAYKLRFAVSPSQNYNDYRMSRN